MSNSIIAYPVVGALGARFWCAQDDGGVRWAGRTESEARANVGNVAASHAAEAAAVNARAELVRLDIQNETQRNETQHTNPDLLRAVVVRLIGPDAHEWGKVEDGEYIIITNPDPVRIVAWLESHGYEQNGALVGDAPRLAVFWLRQTDPRHPEQADAPEYYAQALDCRIVPATCNWNRVDGRITTTRTATQIRRHRSRLTDESAYARDLAFVEQPTQVAKMRAYGLVATAGAAT